MRGRDSGSRKRLPQAPHVLDQKGETLAARLLHPTLQEERPLMVQYVAVPLVPKLVQEFLGHATIAITLDTYSDVLPGMGDQAASAMESVLE